MKLPQYCTRVTPFSKLLAMLLFITFPFVGFTLGIAYQQLVDKTAGIIVTSRVTPVSIHLGVADIGKTAYVHVGDMIYMSSDAGLHWETRSLSQAVLISQIPNQYRVVGKGTTQIIGSGSPVCLRGQLCSQLLIQFSTTIVAK